MSEFAPTVLIVEDDAEVSRLLQLLLRSEGYTCEGESRGDLAVQRILDLQPNLVILDVMLPGLSGLEVCAQVRPAFTGSILMLTGCVDDITEVASFNNGADDYTPKPVRPHILLARVQALLKRCRLVEESEHNHLIVVGGLTLDLRLRRLLYDDAHVELSGAEFDLLRVLAGRPNEIVSRDECCQQLRGFHYDGLDRSVDMRISTLRKKLKPLPGQAGRITTVRNRGYMLVTE